MSTERAFGSMLPELKVRPPGRASRALGARLRAVESPNVTYFDEGWPIFWEEALGANVLDADGNVYVDLTAAFGVALLGHGHAGVTGAVQSQIVRLAHGMGDVHPTGAKVEVLEWLADRTPWEARAVLASTGSEAVEIALKTALMATGRPGVVAFEGAYHGLTAGSLAVTRREHFRAPFRARLYEGVTFVPFPARDGDADRSLAAVREALERGAANGDPVGAVIAEPVQGRAGVRIAPDGFMRALSELVHDAGAVVIADEVLTGLGRCGSFLASERVGLEPDIVCLGKALGGGMPLSACVARAEVMDAWPESEGEAVHTSTFLGHPAACAAGIAVLDALEVEDVAARAASLGDELAAGLRARLAGASGAREVRGLGLLLGIELDAGSSNGPAARVAKEALAQGVLVLPAGERGEVVELTPPVCLTDEQATHALDVVAKAVEAAA